MGFRERIFVRLCAVAVRFTSIMFFLLFGSSGECIECVCVLGIYDLRQLAAVIGHRIARRYIDFVRANASAACKLNTRVESSSGSKKVLLVSCEKDTRRDTMAKRRGIY